MNKERKDKRDRRAYQEKNKQSIREYQKQYRLENRDDINEYKRNYYRKQKEKEDKLKLEQLNKLKRDKTRAELLEGIKRGEFRSKTPIIITPVIQESYDDIYSGSIYSDLPEPEITLMGYQTPPLRRSISSGSNEMPFLLSPTNDDLTFGGCDNYYSQSDNSQSPFLLSSTNDDLTFGGYDNSPRLSSSYKLQ